MLTPMPKANLCENAIAYIREKIVSGKFPPGSRITENSVATALNSSRGPIREAFKILESEGMVSYELNKGYTVVFLSPKEAWEMFFLRGQMEKLALEVAGGNILFPQLMRMENALDKMQIAQRSHDIATLVNADDEFHFAIIANSGIGRLETMWRSLSPLNLSMFYSGKRAAVFDFSNQWEKHVELYDVLCSGELESSIAVVLEHYLTTGKKIYRSAIGGEEDASQ